MLLSDLRVLHQHKRTVHDGAFTPLLDPSTLLQIDTCQRRLWIFPVDSARTTGIDLANFELLSGSDAYRFLLQVSTGLESQIRGETDIFGQIKAAWAQFDASPNADALTLQMLRPWIQRWFEDTKEIRSLYLQKVGGASYGSLVRMILKQTESHPDEPILLVGAGQLAQAILPWIDDHELWLVNRSLAGLEALTTELARRSCKRFKVFTTEDEIRFAYRHAAHVILCIPMQEEEDQVRVALLRTRPRHGLIMHLGGIEVRDTAWETLPGVIPLSELFELQKRQEVHRGDVFSQAELACWEKARHRLLSSPVGGSLSVPHGWEDLAVFAGIR